MYSAYIDMWQLECLGLCLREADAPASHGPPQELMAQKGFQKKELL